MFGLDIIYASLHLLIPSRSVDGLNIPGMKRSFVGYDLSGWQRSQQPVFVCDRLHGQIYQGDDLTAHAHRRRPVWGIHSYQRSRTSTARINLLPTLATLSVFTATLYPKRPQRRNMALLVSSQLNPELSDTSSFYPRRRLDDCGYFSLLLMPPLHSEMPQLHSAKL